MKNKYVICCLFMLCMLVVVPFTSAQQQLKKIQSKGPMFITSASFFQGLQRFPYNSLPEEEGEIKNYTKVSFATMEISQFLGYQISPYFALGLGVGFDYWTTRNANAFVPIYADLRFNMTKGKFAPHLYLNVGYATRWAFTSVPYKPTTGNSNNYIIHGYTSGVIGELGLGLKASVGYSSAIVITVSGRVQESAMRYYEGTPLSISMTPVIVNANSNGLYLFLGLKVGFVF